MDAHLQNDPDRAGGLISDAQGEFVEQESGGAFDPRAFRSDTRDTSAAPGSSSAPSGPDSSAASSSAASSSAADSSAAGSSGEPPMDDERMVGPGEEIDKAR